MTEARAAGTRDGTGAGDHDIPYAFGYPQSCLTLFAQARLLVMRGHIIDYRAGIPGGAADGDLEYVAKAESGLFVPLPVPKENPDA
jgi:hypothetical protein